MRVVHFNTYATGGAAIAARRIHRALLQAGTASEMVYLYPGTHANHMDATENDFRSGLSRSQQFYYKIKNKRLEMRQQKIRNRLPQNEEYFSFMESVWRIQDSVYYERADIVHLHWTSRFLDYNGFFQKNAKPVIFTLHDFFPFTGGYHYPVHPPAENEVIRGQREKWKKMLRNSHMHFVTPSEFLKKAILEMGYDFLADRIDVIHNPVFKEVFYPMDRNEARAGLGLPSGIVFLLFAADKIDYHRKGFDRIRAVLPGLPDHVRVLIAGGSPGVAGDLLHDERITWLGHVESEEKMNRVYNAADLVLHPSRMDNYPNVLAEAFACGVPAVVFNCGGMSEMITEGRNGLRVNTAEQFALAIHEAIKNEWQRTEISKNALQRNESAGIAQAYAALYNRFAK